MSWSFSCHVACTYQYIQKDRKSPLQSIAVHFGNVPTYIRVHASSKCLRTYTMLTSGPSTSTNCGCRASIFFFFFLIFSQGSNSLVWIMTGDPTCCTMAHINHAWPSKSTGRRWCCHRVGRILPIAFWELHHQLTCHSSWSILTFWKWLLQLTDSFLTSL